MHALKVLYYYIKNIIQAIILFIIIDISNEALLMKAICTYVYVLKNKYTTKLII